MLYHQNDTNINEKGSNYTNQNTKLDSLNKYKIQIQRSFAEQVAVRN